MTRFDLDSAAHSINVTAPARLHMGFLDPSGTLGRKFGSIGVAVEGLSTRMRMTVADSLEVYGPEAERVARYAERYCKALELPARFRIDVLDAIPSHIGLGSGTQLALATGAGLDLYFNQQHSVREIAQLTGRGARSGIGIAAFEQGGLVMDGGRRPDSDTVPPLIARLPVPDSWQLLLVFDEAGEGLHGQAELNAFAALPEFPRQRAAELTHLLMMQGLPSVAENDLAAFGEVITRLQEAVGDYFAPVQGGIFTSKRVEQAVLRAAELGAVGLGQSSWGPTGFCMIDGQQAGQALLAQLSAEFSYSSGLRFMQTTVRNRGADVVAKEPEN